MMELCSSMISSVHYIISMFTWYNLWCLTFVLFTLQIVSLHVIHSYCSQMIRSKLTPSHVASIPEPEYEKGYAKF